MPNVSEIVAVYGSTWNDSDAASRARSLEACWSEDGTYSDPTADVAGRDQLAAHIGAFQQQMPGARLEITSGVDQHHDTIRFSWVLKDGNGAVVTDGIDFGELAADGRIQRIVGFFGPPPGL